MWGPDLRGKFTLKTAYKILASTGHHIEQDIWKTVWLWEGPSRVRHFLWLVAHDRVLTNAERCRRHMVAVGDCQRCRGCTEDTLHVVRDCQVAREVWLRLRVLHWIAGVRETMRADSQVISKGASRRIETHIGWKAGPSDCITINTDGSVLQPHSQAAAGGILRTHLGHPVSIFAANLGRCSIMRAELRAAEFGLRIAWDKGYKKVHLQLDSLAAVTAIQENQEEDSRHSWTLDSITELRSRNWEVTISHTFREGNQVADLLAHHGHTLDFGFHVDCFYPHEVDRAIWHDHVGTCFPRTIPMNE
ncbi:Putative ribonuclease H protein At1g65750 [Linum perenne]